MSTSAKFEIDKKLPKISHDRNVNSVSSQTCQAITIANEIATQTDSSTTQYIICNVNKTSPKLPIVTSSVANTQINFLLDTGSSVSLLSESLFEEIKSKLKYKRLSTGITIKTVNSEVNFTACIRMCIKLNSKSFTHYFYIVDIPETSMFDGILGYDFLEKFNIDISLSKKILRVNNNFSVPLTLIHDTETDDSHKSELNNLTISHTEQDVFLTRKIVLEPKTSSWISLVTNRLHNNTNYLFEYDSPLRDLVSFDTVINLNKKINRKHKNKKEQDFSYFLICVKNISEKKIHLPKHTKIGYVTEIEEIVEYSPDLANNNNAHDNHFINLIQASTETINQRKNDLTDDDFKLDHLKKIEVNHLRNLLFSHFAVFSKSLKTLGHTDKIVPDLKFTNDYPIKTLPFPIPQALQKDALNQINELLEADIIERNCSEWACPMLLVKKKPDGSGKQKYRLALDLRMVNTVIQGSSYPLPKIQNIISNLSSYKFFTSLDFHQAYHQIDLPKKFQNQLTFTTMFGSFSYKRLVFGLKSSASIFQALMDSLLDELQLQGVYTYQDDFVIGANSFEEMCNKLERILKLFNKYNLTLSPNKCAFHKSAIDYLGFHIENHCVSPIKSNIIKINSFPVPTTKRQLKRLIGLITFYKSLVPSFSELVQPLINLTTPSAKFKWTDEHQEIFKTIQKIFFNAPMVRLPNWDKTFYVNTDASNISIAGALLQDYNGQLLPVAYFSKSLKPSERKYPALKLELMAIYKTVSAFKYYLYNRNFMILSDSKPLKKYSKTTNPADITTRWLTELSEYSYTFEHIPGSTNVLADYLSRCNFENNQETLLNNPNLLHDTQPLPIVDYDSPITNSSENKIQNINFLISGKKSKRDPLLDISNETFVSEQQKDSNLSIIYNEILQNGPSNKFPNYFIHPDSKVLMLKKEDISNNNFSYHIVVPDSLKSKVLAISHLSHFGLHKTYDFVSSRYFWKGIYVDTLNFVTSCTKCLQSKHHRTPPAPLQPTYTPRYPGHTISIDLLGPFSNGKSVLTVTDHFSRHLELYPLTDTSSPKIIKCLFSYITTFGRPSVILSDLGRQFTSHVYNSFNDTLGIKILHSSVSHPQSNSISERVNLSIKYSISTLMQEGHSFENALCIHKSLYNGSNHSTTLYSPNLLHFGRELSLIFDTYDQQYNQPFLDKNIEVYTLLNDLNKIYDKAYSNIKSAQDKRYQYYGRKAKLRNICLKDIVYLKSVDKFKPRYTGPFVVTFKHSPVSFSIKRIHDPDDSAFRVHIDRLLLAPPRNGLLCDYSSQNFNNPNTIQTSRYNLRKRR